MSNRNNGDSNGNGSNNTGESSDSGNGSTAPLTCGVASRSLSAGDADEDSSSSDNNHNTEYDGAMRIRECARISAYLAATMVKEHTSFSTALPVFAESSPAHRIAETAIDFIWKLGLEHPESGLVPEDDYDRIRMLQFLYIWAAKVVPLLCKRGRIRSGCPDLATLSSWIALQRRRHTKRRGAFWNGRIPSAVEIAVAPLADTLLHSGIIPDTPEYSSLSTWLAAVRAHPHLSFGTLN